MITLYECFSATLHLSVSLSVGLSVCLLLPDNTPGLQNYRHFKMATSIPIPAEYDDTDTDTDTDTYINAGRDANLSANL